MGCATSNAIGMWQYSPCEFDRLCLLRSRHQATPLEIANAAHWECHEFRVWGGIEGKKEIPYVTTQSTFDS